MHLFESSLNVANTPRFIEGGHSKSSLESGELARFSGRQEIRFLMLGPLWAIDLPVLSPFLGSQTRTIWVCELLRTKSTKIYGDLFWITMAKNGMIWWRHLVTFRKELVELTLDLGAWRGPLGVDDVTGVPDLEWLVVFSPGNDDKQWLEIDLC